jgi:hypothetical protein
VVGMKVDPRKSTMTLNGNQMRIVLCSLNILKSIVDTNLEALTEFSHMRTCDACAYGDECIESFETDVTREYIEELTKALEHALKTAPFSQQ